METMERAADTKYLIEAAKNYLHDDSKGNKLRLEEALSRFEKDTIKWTPQDGNSSLA